MSLLTPSVFTGTSRFETLRQLGAGATGVVYEALDRDSGARVALKTLRGFEAAALFRLKHEFRALQGIGHPNLVGLGELHEADGTWFFTMELVEGTDFLSYVRPGSAPRLDDTSTTVDGRRARPDRWPSGSSGVAEAGGPPCGESLDEERLRKALPQVAAGLLALHDAGKVHRDVKPSNVLVTPAGRVAIVDFGLIADLTETRRSEEGFVLGTAAYMPPEQAAGAEIGPSADWYALGVMLFEALTGTVPSRSGQTSRSPRALEPSLPADLDQLCVDLLHPEPARRPSGRAVLARLGAVDLARPVPLPQVFVGREREREELLRAYADSREAAVTVLVTGESGIGKSSLVAEVAGEARGLGATVVSGRCYEREAVPYKGLDEVVDALSEELVAGTAISSPAREHSWALLRLFPVLGRVRPFAIGEGRVPEIPDPAELRDRAHAALRATFADLADQRPLVVVIDDMHWADADSLRLLAALLRPPSAPRMLLLLTARAPLGATLPGQVRTLELGPLDRRAATELGRRLLEATGSARAEKVDALARASGGHPLLLDALVRHAGPAPAPARLDLDEALRRRARDLGGAALRLLELVVVADAPVARRVVGAAAAMAPHELTRALASLANAALVRGTAAGGDRVEAYHGRVRIAIQGAISEADRRRAHEALARALTDDPDGDPDEILRHLEAAGRFDSAAVHARGAAERAMSALAFDRAARLYRLALRAGGGDREALTIGLGDALAAAGRGRDAATAYTEAAELPGASLAAELRRRAADQLLRSGHVDEGVAQVKRSLAEVGVPFPDESRALPSLLWQRARLAARGLRFRPRSEAQVPAAELARIDTCFTAAMGLTMVSTVRGAELQSRQLRLALDAGERSRLVRALCLEACLAASSGGRRSERLLRAARDLAAQTEEPLTDAWVAASVGVSQFFDGRYRDAIATLAQADLLLRERCVGVSWDMATVRVFSAAARFYTGRLGELTRRIEEHLDEARERGDLYAQVNLTTGYGNVLWLVKDRADQALTEVREAVSRWSRAGITVQHWYAMRTEALISLYTGDRRGQLAFVSDLHRLERSLLVHNRAVRAESQLLRARLAIAAGGVSRLAEAERAATRAEREEGVWVRALTALARAGIARGRGDDRAALAGLEQAAAACQGAGMTLFAAAARWAAGEILGGDRGEALARAAAAAFAAEGVRRPERFARVLLGWEPAPAPALSET